MRVILSVAAFLLTLSTAVFAQQSSPQDAREQAIVRAVGELKPQSGTIRLAGGIAQVNADHMAFLSPEDTEKLLVDIWGNPRNVGHGHLGAMIPKGFDPLTEESWAIVLSYSDDGHVADADAEKIDYNDLLADMKQSVKDNNAERLRQGGNELELVGWARPPYYDKASHKLHWAMRLRSRGGESLNYNVRVLGREGVLVLNFIASMNSLAEIEKSIPAVLADVNFTDGNRYEQYNASTDRLAEYGIAALIAGVALKKVGLFAGLFAFILAAKKILLVGAIALIAGLGAFFKRMRRGSRLPPPA